MKPLDDDRALSELALPQMKIAMHVLIIRYTQDRNADMVLEWYSSQRLHSFLVVSMLYRIISMHSSC